MDKSFAINNLRAAGYSERRIADTLGVSRGAVRRHLRARKPNSTKAPTVPSEQAPTGSDLGCTGNPIIKTPHIDHLATESTGLSDYHVAPHTLSIRSSLLRSRWDGGRLAVRRQSFCQSSPRMGPALLARGVSPEFGLQCGGGIGSWRPRVPGWFCIVSQPRSQHQSRSAADKIPATEDIESKQRSGDRSAPRQ